MGNMWRNRAYRMQIGVMLMVGIPLLAVCFWRDLVAGLAGSVLLLALLIAFARFTRHRYRQIAALTAQLAKIAAGDYQIQIAGYSEGELSILVSELLKITTALSHQAGSLRREKAFLADTLADISHQLKTPLTSLSVLADLLESPDLPEAKRQEFLEGIRASLDRLQWLVASLLMLSRLDAGAVQFRKRRVALSAVLADAAKPLRVLMERKEQQLCLDLDAALLVETDRFWLAEAVGNLLKNCAEHAGEGGRIDVRCEQNPIYTQIRIADNGPGVSPGDLPHIFERFYKGENAAPDSVGIGLALSKSVVQHLGGTLTAENRAEGGALFTIKLYAKAAT